MVDNQLVDVKKVEVTGISKGVSVPIVCIPYSQYRTLESMLISALTAISSVQKTLANQSYTSQKLAARDLEGAYSMLNIYKGELINIINDPYNKDCKK